MAITPDSLNGTVSVANALSLTFPHTVGTGNILIVAEGHNGSDMYPTGITYAGAAMTKFRARTSASDCAGLWYKKAPASGTNNVVISWGYTAVCAAGSSSWNNVEQVSTFRNAGAEAVTAGTSPISISITTVPGDMVVDSLSVNSGVGISVSGTQTLISKIDATIAFGHSYQLAAGTSTVNAWSFSSAGARAILVGGAMVPGVVASGGVLIGSGMDGGIEGGLKSIGMSGGMRG
jgi:hypothetical protein